MDASGAYLKTRRRSFSSFFIQSLTINSAEKMLGIRDSGNINPIVLPGAIQVWTATRPELDGQWKKSNATRSSPASASTSRPLFAPTLGGAVSISWRRDMSHLSSSTSTSSTTTTLGSAVPASRHARAVRVNLAGRGVGTASRVNLNLLPPPVDSERPSSIPAGTGTLTSSGSDSKVWRNRRHRLVLGSSGYGSGSVPSVYLSRVFKLVFFMCLFLFLHALLGVGVPRIDSDEDGGPRIHVGNRTAVGKLGAFPGLRHHHHLGLDTDGHYTYAFAFEEEEGHAYTWAWTRDDGEPDHKEPNEDDTSNPPHTPPPLPPKEDVQARQAHVTEPEMEMEVDYPIFELGDPVHALRVHLPMTTTTESSPHSRRGRRARVHGQMLL